MSLVAVDFLKPERSPRAGTALLLFGMALFAAAMFWQQQVATEREHFERAELLQVQQRQAAQKLAASKVPALAERRALQIDRQLQRSMLPALSAIESQAQAPVFLLSLGLDQSTGRARIEAQAPSFEKAMAFTQALGKTGGLDAPTILSHEMVSDPASGPDAVLVRFTVVARWATEER